MSNITILDEKVKEFSKGDFIVRKAIGPEGDLFVKIITIKKIDELQISENLDFNKCVMGDLDSMIFPQNLLKLEEEINSSTIVGFVTKPYQHLLFDYVKGKKVQEKEALRIFDDILKGVYSLYMEEFLTRQVRSEHIVYSEGKWRLATLIFNHDHKSSGNESEYLWSNKHEAPQCKSIIQDDEFESMIVWNLGCILLEILLQNHKFPTKEAKDKIKNQLFTFKGFGLKENIWKDFSPQIEEAIQKMLMYDPKKRMSLGTLFSNQFLSPEVSKHYKLHKPSNKSQRIVIGKSSVRMGKLNESNRLALKAAELDLEERENILKKTVKESNLREVLDEDQFEEGLKELGEKSIKPIKPPSKIKEEQHQEIINNPYTITPASEVKNGQKYNNPYTPVESKGPKEAESIEQIMKGENKHILQALHLYKSFHDQSQLLNLSLDVIKEMKFPQMKAKQVEELHLLIQYSVNLVSLINLNALSEGLNHNINVLELDGDLFSAFAGSSQCSNFKKFVNILKNERSEELEEIKSKINYLKEKPLTDANPLIPKMLKANYKTTSFKDIKTAYRFIVKHAYDRISEEYNINKHTEKAESLSRIAMYVTYCLTTDKLYIKEDISDNFKFFFEWAHKQPSNLVPLNEFKEYLDRAPKQTLIKNSRYILKKYYDT